MESETEVATLTFEQGESGEKLKVVMDGSLIQDKFRLENIKEASNGFTFDVEEFSFLSRGGNLPLTLKGYNGFVLGENTTCDGAYISATKKLEFYCEMPREDFYELFVDEMMSDEEWVKSCLEEKGYANEDEIRAYALSYAKENYGKYRFVLDFECTKK